MNESQISIITKAVKILFLRGMSIDDALSRYPKLTESEKAVIKDRIARV